MSWYYDDESNTNYYEMYKRAKEFEKMRKAKKKKAKIRKEKLAKEKLRLKLKQERIDKKINEKVERKEKKKQTLEQLREVGYKPLYTKQNPLKRAKNSRDLNLCKEIYYKSKEGKSTFTLAKEYDLHPNTILRHKYEYEYYLGIKSLDKEPEI